MKKIFTGSLALMLHVLCYENAVAQNIDITNDGGTVLVQHETHDNAEKFKRIIDNNTLTDYYIKKQLATWITYKPTTATLIQGYTLSSGTEKATRDPKSWVLEGSQNNADWITLDSQTNQAFSGRSQTRRFNFSNTVAYNYYRLNIIENNGDQSIQITEWELWGVPVPYAPTDLTAAAQSGKMLQLTWADNATDEAGFEISRSTDGVSFSPVDTVGANVTEYLNAGLSAATTYYYKVRAIGQAGNSNYSNSVAATTPAVPEDITNNGGVLTSQYSGRVSSENFDKVIDDNVNTKYFQNGQKVFWVQYQSPYAAILENYSITSANDSPDRDPKSWNLQGSSDGIKWITLDAQTNQTFTSRFQKKTYTISDGAAYIYYRLNITGNNGSADSQFSEWELWGKKSLQQPPVAPGDVTAVAPTSSQVNLAWTDNAKDEESFRIDRSADGATYFTIATVGANVTAFTDQNLSAGTSYLYRVYAVNSAGLTYSNSPVVSTPSLEKLADLTDYSAGVISDKYTTAGAEGIAKIIDNNIYTKYLTFNSTTWLQYHIPGGGVASQYAITSANDASERDPKDWTFAGSNDGTTWTVLHAASNQVFPNRHKTLTYGFENTASYAYYRLNITANKGASIVQIAELQIFGNGAANPNIDVPAVPADFTATAVTDNQIVLTWRDNSPNETGFRLERSTDGSNWDWSTPIEANNTKAYSFSLAGNTAYYYRLRAESAQGNSEFTNIATATTPVVTAPATWQEHWFDHSKVVSLVYENPDLNLYFDENMDNSAEWMKTVFTDVWKYTRDTYGGFSDPKLYAVMHLNSYSGGHPGTVFDGSHDYRNVIDMGQSGTWSAGPTGWNLDILVHEIGHIVEGSSKGVKESPAFSLWGDSKWCEIFQYDVYKTLGYTTEANRWYTNTLEQTESYPRAGTKWFKNWFLPIYEQYGGSAVLNNYFQLLSEYFPKYNGAYTRGMNWGEFIHFWSGAAGVNLKQQATIAFGWPEEWEFQFRQAQIDFPFTYPDPSSVTTSLNRKVATPGVENGFNKKVSVWPNPSSDIMNIAVLDKEGADAIEIYSMMGAKVYSGSLKNNATAIYTASFKPGIYILNISGKKGSIHKQRIVIK